ncbi:MAG TPA: ketoacyl-ACP synthase III [Thermoanaerobacter sp.]|nr:ketoacyl-ACP synthase III [Thermoanaerobacter sp.]
MRNRAYIKDIASYLPAQKLTNDELIKDYPDWDVEKIYNKTGISTRAIAGKNECASDLAVAAAEKLFEKGICKGEEVEFLILCTQSPDYYLPTTACIVQDRLKLPTTCGAFDINLGCSGYVYGLSIVKGMIESGIVSNVLLITSETYSKYLHPSDRSVRTIFGDGAAATFISSIESEEELIGPFVFGTDGSGADLLIVPAGGLRMPVSQETKIEQTFDDGAMRSPQNLFMDGAEIFNFTLKSVPSAVKELLKKSKMTIDDIDMYIFHQANAFMLETLRKKIKIPKEKFCVNNEEYGNTVSSTIPMAIELELEKNSIKKGDKLMLVGFGVGLSWAGTIIKYI